MAIRLIYDVGAIGGLAGYAAGRGKARERATQQMMGHLTDIYRSRLNYQSHQAALEQQRGQFAQRRDWEVADTRERRKWELEDAAEAVKREESRSKAAFEERVMREELARTKEKIDEISAASGGHFAGGYDKIWSKMMADEKKIMEDKNLSPSEKMMGINAARQEAINQFDATKHAVPWDERPGNIYVKDGAKYRKSRDPKKDPEWLGFESPEAADDFYKKHFIEKDGKKIYIGPSSMKPVVVSDGAKQGKQPEDPVAQREAAVNKDALDYWRKIRDAGDTWIGPKFDSIDDVKRMIEDEYNRIYGPVTPAAPAGGKAGPGEQIDEIVVGDDGTPKLTSPNAPAAGPTQPATPPVAKPAPSATAPTAPTAAAPEPTPLAAPPAETDRTTPSWRGFLGGGTLTPPAIPPTFVKEPMAIAGESTGRFVKEPMSIAGESTGRIVPAEYRPPPGSEYNKNAPLAPVTPRQINAIYKSAARKARLGKTQEAQALLTGQNIPRVRNVAEFTKLRPGTVFIDPYGNRRKKLP